MKIIYYLLFCMLLGSSIESKAIGDKVIVSPSVAAQRTLFSLSDVRLYESQFKDIQDLNHNYLLSLEPDRLLSWFRREAGLTSKAAAYPFWESEDVWGGGPLAGHILGFYLSSMSMMYESTGDDKIRRKIEYVLEELKKCQDAQGDGYLSATINGRHIFEEVVKGNFTTNNPTINGVWEPVYIMNKIMLGLYNVYLSFDLPLAKTILLGMADWFGSAVLDKLDYGQIQKLLVCEHGSINESFVDVYTITGDKKYLEWAKLLNDEDMLIPAAEHRDVLNGWHANTQIPKFTGFEKVYNYTRDDNYTKAALFFWETVVNKHTWIIGGNSTGEHFFPIDEFEKRITDIGGPESCNSVNMMRLTESLYKDYALMEMIDYYERVLFNHILANYDPHEGMCTYYTSMRPGHYRMYGTKFHSFWCCTGTGMEAPAKFGKMIYAYSGDNLYVNMFIASEVTWRNKGIKLSQKTNFPDQNKVEYVIKSDAPCLFTLNIRQPYWNDSGTMSIVINGKNMKLSPDENGYISLKRLWKDGDQLEIELTPKLSLEYLNGSHQYAAFTYGPVVLATKVDNNGLVVEDDFRLAKKTVASEEIPILKAPALIGSLGKILGNISRKIGKELVFKCSSKVSSFDFELLPFNRIHFNRYAVYFPVYKQKKDYVAAYIQEKDMIDESDFLIKNTVDRVSLKSPLSESEHQLDGVNMGWGEAYGQTWRHAVDGGYIMYRMSILPESPQSVYMKFISTDQGNRKFDILVDGCVIGTLDHSIPRKSSTLFYNEMLPIPEHLIKDKQQITVKLQAKSGNIVGGIFDLRIVKTK